MAYLGDPREQAIDIDNHVIWEEDNRIEERYQWGAMITDLCDLSPEEYMKNPIVEAIQNGSGGGSGGGCDKEAIEEATKKLVKTIKDTSKQSTDTITETINNATEQTTDKMDESTDDIVEAIYSASTMIINSLSGSSSMEVLFYYTQVNHQVDPYSISKNIFQPGFVVVGSDAYFDYILGDPTEEDWQKYITGEITEKELRQLSCNDYYIAIPVAYDGKMTLQENATVDITDSFVKVENLNLFDGYYIYRSVDDDYFNEDYETGETNVKIPFKITITK